MTRAGRIAVAIVGLAAAGAVMGAVAGVIVGLTMLGGMIPAGFFTGAVLRATAGVGAVCGLVLAPLASFTALRRVPLWRVFAETTVGTAVGGCLAELITRLATGDRFGVEFTLGCGAIGFAIAVAHLAWRARRTTALPTA